MKEICVLNPLTDFIDPSSRPDLVQVWRFFLDASDRDRERLQATLSDDEKQRANRFYFAKDRNRFIIARGILRILLGHCLNKPPAQVSFQYNQFGKPCLGEEDNPSHLAFNISHSANWGLFAIGTQGELGIDIEQIRPEMAILDIAKRFFSEYEVEIFDRIDQEEQQTAFFHCWTRKEAFIKAKGMGLSLPLDRFDVEFYPGKKPGLLAYRDNPAETAEWEFKEIPAPKGFAAALAVRHTDFELMVYDPFDDF